MFLDNFVVGFLVWAFVVVGRCCHFLLLSWCFCFALPSDAVEDLQYGVGCGTLEVKGTRESVFEEETLEVEGGLDDKERGGVDAEEEGGYGDDPKRVEGGKEGGGDQEEEGQLGESRM